MNLLLRQLWALIRKNLLIIVARRPISTFIRAVAIPLVVVLVVAFSKNFFASSQHWGVSSPHEIHSLEDGLKATAKGRDTVAFIDNGMKGGAVASVIDSLSQRVRNAKKTPVFYKDEPELALHCRSNDGGDSACYGAVIFLSSPDEAGPKNTKGVWNYTIRGDNQLSSAFIDVRGEENRVQVYQLPLQRAVDMEIISRSRSDNTTELPTKTDEILYTSADQSTLQDSREKNFLSWCVWLFGAIFSFAMIGIVYHMVSFVATERELGMSGLIDTMLPGASVFRARLVRQLAAYLSFAAVYLPSWLVIGIVISVVVYPETSHNVPIGYHFLSGLAFCSFSLFASSLFKKAQLSGSIVTVVTLVFAILPQVLWKQSRSLITAFSLIFPSANYTYFITGMGLFELEPLRLDLMATVPGENEDVQRIELYLHLVFLSVQIVVYPMLAFFLEHLLFSTASHGRGFAKPSSPADPTVTLTGFSKTYQPGIFARIFKRRKNVRAVIDMSLGAYQGQILCLLGPNGSGKSTTLNCVAGQQKVTSGNIVIDPTGGLGYAPQSNVLWPELTVEEHIRIFSDLKCIANVNEEIVTELVKSCDLQHKLPAKAKTLSGGQKRKLQLAMMFAGGSAVCCVDEVSTGLDPISRRRIWEILLAERGRRTIIMTTHFLDEADFLADNVAIMFKGSLKAEGTSAALKHRYGNGYTVKIPDSVDLDVSLSGPVEKESARHQMVYRVATAALVAELVELLERNKIHDYQVSGPTMEELFLKATGDHIEVTDKSSQEHYPTTEAFEAPLVGNTAGAVQSLTDGRPISAFKQWWILLRKRYRILRRRYIPYFFVLAIAIVGAGIAPLLIKSLNKPMVCPTPADLVDDYSYRSTLGSVAYPSYNIAIGPSDKIDPKKLAVIADIYSLNHSRYDDFGGFENVTEITDMFAIVNTFDEFKRYIDVNHSSSYSVGYMLGGIWLGDTPTLAYEGSYPMYSSALHNLMNILLTGVPISSGQASFAWQTSPSVFDFKALIFMVYYGLIMACYPAFFALYPTNERISNVRSMQYSNGIRPLPLWLSHLAFDAVFVLVIAVVATGLLSASTPIWVGLGYIFFIMFLYGIVSALLSYIISMFAKSAVAAWFFCCLGQVILYFAYFAAGIGVQSSVFYPDLEHVNNQIYFGLGIISPVVSLERAFAIGLGQFAYLCHDRALGSIQLFGGPILYLILQGIVLFAVLLWWDSSFTLPSFFHRAYKPKKDQEATEMDSQDLMRELQRLKSQSTDLHVESVSRSFGKNLAVDNVTFAVQTSEIFALLGPNGAGKSTIISMIRGDIKPSTSVSNILISNHSILRNPVSARASLGVCPQFDSADALTVSETLRFFAKTRGVTNISHNVDTVLSACGLSDYAHQLAAKLSGGTKRKLSLAVALVGNPRVLVLDEPSSALDANAKRNMWRTLQSVAKGRAVVLTTHSMEEADALADRIGIVSSRMLAVGERESLKKRAGDSFHVHLVSRSSPHTTPQELARMKAWIGERFSNAQIARETAGGQVRFVVPAEGNELVGLIRVLEGGKAELGVEFYSVGRATLDEVFENIVRRYGDYGGLEK
ncbi:P-loop containing nucleoside triphosphate hydrolase protein [Polyplosphaeria fusca]|uniref:P-loop containing nucleoside triphosphate hydrolase protein n=1 Tax=Polyplosphaeria fusca TaxID=682080 RepID=A0A9P4UXC1_9PLEO|nr:P-loop containing nucleoside triphosphate hydrolase protein [Polyplosphaeria fusca]